MDIHRLAGHRTGLWHTLGRREVCRILCELQTHAPDVVPEFCLPLDKPWEKGSTAYATFLENAGLLCCWYEHGNAMAYAESDDGITRRKPNLGQRNFEGSTANNLLGFYMHGAEVLIDPPSRRLPNATRWSAACGRRKEKR